MKVERKTVQADGSTNIGHTARLLAEGFFDQSQTGNAVFIELKRRGATLAKPTAYAVCDQLNSMGFLTKTEAGYHAVEGMKVNIIQ